MTYNPNIPLSTDYIGSSQQAIEDNFTELNTQFRVDHIAFNTGSGNGSGFHRKITFSAPIGSPTIVATQGVAYPRTIPVTTPSSTNTELFYKNAGRDTQMTSSALLNTLGEGFIPGGLQIRSGIANYPGDAQFINFTKPFPTACVSVCACIANSGDLNSTINVVSFAANRFQVISPQRLQPNLTYIAVGY